MFVASFEGKARTRREALFGSFEQLVQALLTRCIPCEVRLDGSFLTKKPEPSDIDVVVALDEDVSGLLTPEQNALIFDLNTSELFVGLDCTVWVNYTRESENFGRGLDADAASEGYGLENGQRHLKGYVVLRLWETDVGLRISR
nr:hypothetical protein [Enterovirga rhinocerotis]